ncbi:uncharacterized protein [Haliotis cracherodii]|uniref:uncharacterized protein n=1 Tax=Haliotis cracherodii TaxID=6455 RepID=UPI0039E94CE2
MLSSADTRLICSGFLALAVSGLPAHDLESHVTSGNGASDQSDFTYTVTLGGVVLTVIIVLLALCVRGRKEATSGDGVKDIYAVPNKQAKKKSKREDKTEKGEGEKTGDDVMQANALYTEYKESKQVSRKVRKQKKKKPKKTRKTEAVYENVDNGNTGNNTEKVQDVYAVPNKKAKKRSKRAQECQAQMYENVEI